MERGNMDDSGMRHGNCDAKPFYERFLNGNFASVHAAFILETNRFRLQHFEILYTALTFSCGAKDLNFQKI
jgi:hypothetical protein